MISHKDKIKDRSIWGVEGGGGYRYRCLDCSRSQISQEMFLNEEEDSCWNLGWTDEEEPVKEKEEKQRGRRSISRRGSLGFVDGLLEEL